MIEENGIVLENLDNEEIAKILVEKSSACGNCSAKSFCHPFGEKSEVIVNAVNNIGAKKGDKVRVVIKSSTSGCAISIESIKAPLLPFCATSLVVLENLFIKETAPEVLPAALETLDPDGRRFEISTPTVVICLTSN